MTPLPDVPKARAGSILRRFRRNRSGSAAIEFALIAPVFFALLFAIIETATMFFASQVLETMTQDSARQIMTGQAQNGALSATQFHDNVVCPMIPALFTCTSVYVDVESFSQFSSVSVSTPIDGSGNFINNMQYNPGGPCAIVMVRLFYQWPLYVTGLGYNISNMSGNQRLLSASAAFKNEPYNGTCS
jgi:Flp pilus assembly protein TadG